MVTEPAEALHTLVKVQVKHNTLAYQRRQY